MVFAARAGSCRLLRNQRPHRLSRYRSSSGLWSSHRRRARCRLPAPARLRSSCDDVHLRATRCAGDGIVLRRDRPGRSARRGRSRGPGKRSKPRCLIRPIGGSGKLLSSQADGMGPLLLSRRMCATRSAIGWWCACPTQMPKGSYQSAASGPWRSGHSRTAGYLWAGVRFAPIFVLSGSTGFPRAANDERSFRR